jgi:pimeloyl-ACP methyl ester carboxylesterase
MTIAEVEHHTIDAAGLRMHVAAMGEGPTVLLLHGFPERWTTWREQMPALAAAGYRTVAPDMRGYGDTDAPAHGSSYSAVHTVGDTVALVEHFGGEAVLVGHDWGCIPAWNTALLRPDLVRAVVGTSVPFSPSVGMNMLDALDAVHGSPHHYQRWFQTDAAEDEFSADPRRWLLAFYDALSGHHGRPHTLGMGEGERLLDSLAGYGEQPPWMDDQHLQFLVDGFTRTGLRGGLNWYRAADVTNELMRPWRMRTLAVPAAYLVGELDVVYRWPGMADVAAMLPSMTPRHLGTRVLPGIGHWTGEEAPAATNEFLLEVLGAL